MERIRDKGKSPEQARAVQELVGYLGQMTALPVTEIHPVRLPIEEVTSDGNIC